jgi:hypothetical protein
LDLNLIACKFASPATFRQLASATSLTALELQLVWWDDSPQPQAAAGTASQPSALAAVLQACSRLRRLTLRYWERANECMPLSSLAVVSGLQQLQDLTLFLPNEVAGLPLPDLPSGLTRLLLGPANPPWQLRTTYSLLQQDLSQLRGLWLCNIGVDVSALSSMSKLYRLTMDRCVLLPEAATLSSRVSALLAVVGQLTRLRKLKLVLDFEGEEEEGEEVPSAAFSALTASSQLQVLHIELSLSTDMALPGPDVLQHMFPTGRQLGQLHTLVLGSVEPLSSQWHVPAADLARIVASCPALQDLSLVDVLEPGDEAFLRHLFGFRQAPQPVYRQCSLGRRHSMCFGAVEAADQIFVGVHWGVLGR